MPIFIERIRNQKVDIMGSVISTYMKNNANTQTLNFINCNPVFPLNNGIPPSFNFKVDLYFSYSLVN